MLFRSVENDIVSQTLPRTVVALDDWDGEGVPDEETFFYSGSIQTNCARTCASRTRRRCEDASSVSYERLRPALSLPSRRLYPLALPTAGFVV